MQLRGPAALPNNRDSCLVHTPTSTAGNLWVVGPGRHKVIRVVQLLSRADAVGRGRAQPQRLDVRAVALQAERAWPRRRTKLRVCAMGRRSSAQQRQVHASGSRARATGLPALRVTTHTQSATPRTRRPHREQRAQHCRAVNAHQHNLPAAQQATAQQCGGLHAAVPQLPHCNGRTNASCPPSVAAASTQAQWPAPARAAALLSTAVAMRPTCQCHPPDSRPSTAECSNSAAAAADLVDLAMHCVVCGVWCMNCCKSPKKNILTKQARMWAQAHAMEGPTPPPTHALCESNTHDRLAVTTRRRCQLQPPPAAACS
jgi:hypothetical protein